MGPFSRRGFLKAMGVGAGAVIGTRISGSSLLGVARAATPEPTSVVCVYLDGGINAIFTGADAFINTAFGVTEGNVTKMGGVVIDNALASAIPEAIRNRVASVGIRHGINDHRTAKRSLFMNGNAPLMLANAIGGDGAIKAAFVGGNNLLPDGERPAPINGVSLQSIRDMRATLELIAGGRNGPLADRAGIAKGVAAARAMSKGALEKNKVSLASFDRAYSAALATLSNAVELDADDFNQAYGLEGKTSVNDFRTSMAAAELMVRSGTNVVIAQDVGWDSHGDRDGNVVRKMVQQRIAGPLGTFLQRMVAGAAGTRNVIVALFGDFHRGLPGSDHQPSVSALVIGKPLKNATTGKTDARVALPPNTPGIAGLWQLLAAASKVDQSPFGANPHDVLA